MHRILGLSVITITLAYSAIAQNPYQPTWESLATHYQTPEWFKDAKFGIYAHWGPVTVGSESIGKGWAGYYARQMYETDGHVFKFHQAHFGDQNNVGYKDIIPLFKPEKFDANEWADLFAAAGAKFAGPVAIHHDNFAMWDSSLTQWDSMDSPAKRDFTGELEKAIKSRQMKFITTFHHGWSWVYYLPAYTYDASDGQHIDLYGEAHKQEDIPTKRYNDMWLAKVNEVVNKYEPDLIWFDFGLKDTLPEAYRLQMFADFYNWGEAQNKQVAVAHKHTSIHKYAGILDFERGRAHKVTPYPWLTDTSVGMWFHHQDTKYKTANYLIDVLVDIVAKNGCMLLNVDPKMDGTIPDTSKQLLQDIGQWLNINGEAIYATRPLTIYGEGPSKMEKSGYFSEKTPVSHTKEDVRFTQSKDGKTLYIIVLDWPSKSFATQSLTMEASDDAAVVLLGHSGKIDFAVSPQSQITVQMPTLSAEQRPCQHAYVFKLTGFQFSINKDYVVDEEPELRTL